MKILPIFEFICGRCKQPGAPSIWKLVEEDGEVLLCMDCASVLRTSRSYVIDQATLTVRPRELFVH